jgi:hypothetical protein
MRRLTPLLLVLVSACASGSSVKKKPKGENQVVARADVGVKRVGRAATGFALEVGGNAPRAMAHDAGAGRGWLAIDGPLGFSFPARELLAGEAPWKPASAEVTFAQRASRSGGTSREAALIRMEGVASFAPVVAIGKPDLAVRGLDSIGSQDARVLLGRGIDQLVGSGDKDAMETVVWVDVVDGSGAPAKWRERLREANRARTLAPLADRFVVVKRVRVGDSYYRVPLDLVILASQSNITREEDDRFRWVWEGLWHGEMVAMPAALEFPEWETTLKLRYREYEFKRARSRSLLWRTVLAPVTLTADIGAAMFDPDAEEGLYKEVKERREDRGN